MPALARHLLAVSDLLDVRETLRRSMRTGESMADRVLTNALALLATRAEDPKAHLVPSRPVEQGWQALVLHTEVYADLCSRMGGGFIHHRPLQTVPTQRLLTYTANRIAGCGHHIDYDLWQAEDSGEERVGIEVASL